MGGRIVECVANFSEGRDAGVVDRIAAAARSVTGAALLDRQMDSDHNRCVLTLAGEPDAMSEAAFCAIRAARDLIDLRRHQGVHPRIGAADVVPFVPLRGVTMADCVRLAEHTGERVWRELGVPVYLYREAARQPDRRKLENIRRGGFEKLRAEVATNPARHPDFGDAALHPTAGAAIVGARNILVAYNLVLDTADVQVARRIARALRESSGGLPAVKALGVMLESRHHAQVSMNLIDFERTSMETVFDRAAEEAAKDGAHIVSSEIVGLVPRRALESAAGHYLRVAGFHPGMILENRLAEAFDQRAGLEDFVSTLSGAVAAAAASGAMAARLAGEFAAPEDSASLADIRASFLCAATAKGDDGGDLALQVVELASRLSALLGPEPPADGNDAAFRAARALAAAAYTAALSDARRLAEETGDTTRLDEIRARLVAAGIA